MRGVIAVLLRMVAPPAITIRREVERTAAGLRRGAATKRGGELEKGRRWQGAGAILGNYGCA